MTHNDPKILVSTEWLAEHLDDPDVRILDASWYLPADKRNPAEEYSKEHIPGAVYFDIDAISDKSSPLPHMAPPAEQFSSQVRRMGIGSGHHIVVYDTAGIFSAARAWWLFKLMGHDDVAVLDGGFKKWQAENRPVEDRPSRRTERHLIVRKQSHLVKSYEEVEKASSECTAVIVDARSSGRFMGLAPEPRKGLRAGSIPNSKNLPFQKLLNRDGTFKELPVIRKAFEAAGVDLAKPIITTCGSGVTAAILSLALTLLGHHNHSLYDGSWADWGNR